MFRRLLYIIGIGAIIGGILSGSYAGNMPELLGIEVKPILNWFSDPVQLIIFSIIVGLIHVNIAHFVRTINFARLKNVFGVIQITGFFITEIFGIPYILRTIFRYDFSPFLYVPSSMLFYVCMTGLVIYILCKTKIEGAFGIFLWVFDLSTLLGDVLSYSRLAGVGLAGAFLASAFNRLCLMVFQAAYGFSPGTIGIILGIAFGIVIFTLGHLVNVGLSVIGSFIHSLRLCFVEFLPKFYSGTGTGFTPMKLEMNKKILVGGSKI